MSNTESPVSSINMEERLSNETKKNVSKQKKTTTTTTTKILNTTSFITGLYCELQDSNNKEHREPKYEYVLIIHIQDHKATKVY